MKTGYHAQDEEKKRRSDLKNHEWKEDYQRLGIKAKKCQGRDQKGK